MFWKDSKELLFSTCKTIRMFWFIDGTPLSSENSRKNHSQSRSSVVQTSPNFRWISPVGLPPKNYEVYITNARCPPHVSLEGRIRDTYAFESTKKKKNPTRMLKVSARQVLEICMARAVNRWRWIRARPTMTVNLCCDCKQRKKFAASSIINSVSTGRGINAVLFKAPRSKQKKKLSHLNDSIKKENCIWSWTSHITHKVDLF